MPVNRPSHDQLIWFVIAETKIPDCYWSGNKVTWGWQACRLDVFSYCPSATVKSNNYGTDYEELAVLK